MSESHEKTTELSLFSLNKLSPQVKSTIYNMNKCITYLILLIYYDQNILAKNIVKLNL